MKHPIYNTGIWVGAEAVSVLLNAVQVLYVDSDIHQLLDSAALLAHNILRVASTTFFSISIVRFRKDYALEVISIPYVVDNPFEDREEFEAVRDTLAHHLRLGGCIHLGLPRGPAGDYESFLNTDPSPLGPDIEYMKIPSWILCQAPTCESKSKLTYGQEGVA